MLIYKNPISKDEYTTDDAIMDEPCYLDSLGYIYPVLTKDYNRFSKYAKYIVFSEKHLNLQLNLSLLECLILLSMETIGGEEKDAYCQCILQLESLFSIITRTDVRIRDYNNLIFSDDKKTVVIDTDNFNTLRKIVLKQNMLQEPKIYTDPYQAKWMEKARIAKMKNTPTVDIGEIITIVSCGTGKTYEVIKNQNILQLYADYYRLIQVANYEAITLFKTVSEKLPDIKYIEPIVNELYKDPDADMRINSNNLTSRL